MNSNPVTAILAMSLSAIYSVSVVAQSEHKKHLHESNSAKSIETKDSLNACNSMHQTRQCSMMKHMTGQCLTIRQPSATAFGASVKSKLAITHSQQLHWQKYEITLREYYEFTTTMRQNGQVNTATQILHARAEILQQHANILKTMGRALGKLYVALTPRQRQLADKIIPNLICKM